MTDHNTKNQRLFVNRRGKTRIGVLASKVSQARGERVLWATDNQVETAAWLAEHGALSEVVGDFFLAPRFRSEPKEGPDDAS